MPEKHDFASDASLSLLRPGIAAGLIATLAFGVLTAWTARYWPVACCNTALFLMCVGWCTRQALLRLPVRASWEFAPVWLLAAWGPLQFALGTTVYRFATLKESLQWAACAVAFLLATQILDTPANLRAFRNALFWTAAAVFLFCTLQWATSHGKILWLAQSGGERTFGPFVNRNDYAAFLEMLLPFLIYKALRSRTGWMFPVVAGGVYGSVLLSASRAGTIIGTAILVLVPLAMAGHRSRGSPGSGRSARAGRVVLVFAAAALFAGLFGWRDVWRRLVVADPLAGRYEWTVSSYRMFLQRPWLGHGMGSWAYIYPAYAIRSEPRRVNAAHNDWAQWAAEGGFAVPLLMASIFYWSAVRSWRFPWGIGVPAVLLHSAVDFPLQNPALKLWLFVLMGTLSAAAAASHLDPRPSCVQTPAARTG